MILEYIAIGVMIAVGALLLYWFGKWYASRGDYERA